MKSLIEKCMIFGITGIIIIIPLFLLTYNTDLSDESLAWVTLIVSVEAGIIITLIVKEKADESLSVEIIPSNMLAHGLLRINSLIFTKNLVLSLRN